MAKTLFSKFFVNEEKRWNFCSKFNLKMILSQRMSSTLPEEKLLLWWDTTTPYQNLFNNIQGLKIFILVWSIIVLTFLPKKKNNFSTLLAQRCFLLIRFPKEPWMISLRKRKNIWHLLWLIKYFQLTLNTLGTSNNS